MRTKGIRKRNGLSDEKANAKTAANAVIEKVEKSFDRRVQFAISSRNVSYCISY